MALVFTSTTNGNAREAAPINGAEAVAVSTTYTLSTANNVTGNIIDFITLPADTTLVDATLISDDLDSNGAPAVLFDVGIMSGSPGEALDAAGGARTIGAEVFSASTIAQAGGVAKPTLKTAYRITPTAYDRSIGVKINTQSATAVSGDITLILLLRAAQA